MAFSKIGAEKIQSLGFDASKHKLKFRFSRYFLCIFRFWMLKLVKKRGKLNIQVELPIIKINDTFNPH
jgi:hypothetical protein